MCSVILLYDSVLIYFPVSSAYTPMKDSYRFIVLWSCFGIGNGEVMDFISRPRLLNTIKLNCDDVERLEMTGADFSHKTCP